MPLVSKGMKLERPLVLETNPIKVAQKDLYIHYSIFPSALVIWTSASFILPYVTAVILGHVDTFVPYISDTGMNPPEKCLFGIMLDISSLLGSLTMFIRYKQVSAFNHDNRSVPLLNTIGLSIGLVSCFGLCLVANFQKAIFKYLHIAGASLTFGVGTIYILFQTIITFKMEPEHHSKRVLWGFMPHIASTISEWFLAFSFLSFFLTYIQDFQSVLIHVDVDLHEEEERSILHTDI
ncbi:DNA damage-regulated autophagy modulator protein 2 [Rhinophrynus dorsalis]